MLLPSDHDYIKKKLRNDFDSLTDAYQESQWLEIIAMAERMGYGELANEMKSDLNIPSRQSITHSPSISDRAEGYFNPQ